ncbi:tubulin-specific chaperone D-like [Hyperolius riggenbachi]|uniref:tubulin-specific chaperone D-like n=1 Tax=Hyperolius riggenbachi TaxID=752182 RepID=UPI0035A2926F
MAADRAEQEEDGSPEIVLSGNILGSFTESKQTRDLIVNLQMSCMEPVSRELCAQRFNVMDNYQEQPHLLDPHLGLRIQACCMQELC